MLASLEETRHIVRYYNAWLEDGHLYIQMERMEYSLDSLIGTAVPESALTHILHDVLIGLADIHRQGIVHLDIKVRWRVQRATFALCSVLLCHLCV